jgi:hypothetical protein
MLSPGNVDVYFVSPPSSPAKGKGKLRREEKAGRDFWGCLTRRCGGTSR